MKTKRIYVSGIGFDVSKDSATPGTFHFALIEPPSTGPHGFTTKAGGISDLDSAHEWLPDAAIEEAAREFLAARESDD